jgi:hypothetical protein
MGAGKHAAADMDRFLRGERVLAAEEQVIKAAG